MMMRSKRTLRFLPVVAAGVLGFFAWTVDMGQAKAQTTPTRSPATLRIPLPAGMPTIPGAGGVPVAGGVRTRPVIKVTREPVKRGTGTESGEGYEIYGTTDPRTPRFAVIGAPRPDHHVVRSGDTLWDICETYFRDPWRWPKVWAMNPSITNPHWIYPGDRVRLRKQSQIARSPKKSDSFSVVPRHVHRATPVVALRQNAYLEEKKVKSAGIITGSPHAKIMLATYDTVYISTNRKKPLKVGQRYTVFKPRKLIRHPGSKRKLGRLVEIFAEVQIQEIKWAGKKGTARGVLINAVNPVERGYLVAKLKRRFRSVAPIDNVTVRSFDATVTTVFQTTQLIGTRQLTFLDAGKNRKVKRGHVFFVIRKGDGYRRTMELDRTVPKAQRKWPVQKVAVLVVVDVGDNHSVAVVQSAIKEVRVGDRVRLQYSGSQR